ncbi:MAG: GNAT family N-acetyltransferase [Planktomarina sp.]
MTLPNNPCLYDAINTTWPARSLTVQNGWDIRDGAGGGKRVSAATLAADALPDIALAEAAMKALNQGNLFMIRDGEDELDTALAARGYRIIDPVTLYACDNCILVNGPLPIAQSYAVWDPIHVMVEIWAAGGIPRQRIDLMHRVTTPKTGILARDGDTPAGTAFIAMHGDVAMIHAVEVLANHRRQGVAQKIMAQAAHWAARQGAKYMTLMTTTDNIAANTLYQQMGMTAVGNYHYRIKDHP